MEVIFSNGVRYSIEFIKLILVVVNILDIQIKKGINVVFGISFLGIICVSNWFDISEYSVVYGLLAIVILGIMLYKKRKIIIVALAYVGISVLDMIIANVCINLFGLTINQIQNEFMITIVLNSVLLLLLLVLSMIMRTKRVRINSQIDMYLPIFVLGAIALSVYLTVTQFVGLELEYRSYQRGLIVSSLILVIVFLLICYLLIEKHAKNRYLRAEINMNQRLLKTQNDYYNMMLKKDTETKMFRHDIKQHVMSIQMLYAQKKYDELGDYLDQMEKYTKELSPEISTGNIYIDMILMDLMVQFPDVIIEWIGKVPELSIVSMDVCTLFYNLLKNAFESAHNISNKSVKIIVKIQGTNLMLTVMNYYDDLCIDSTLNFVTTKKEIGHGYGIKNIKRCVNKYNGFYNVTTENRLFCTEIILPDVISNE